MSEKEILEIPARSNKEIDPKISAKCGKGGCPFYDKHNQLSKCSIYSNRQECTLSNRHRRKNANHNRRRNELNWYS